MKHSNKTKISCVLGAAALVFSLTACGPAQPSSSQPETPPPSSQDTQEPQPTPLQQLKGEFEAVPKAYTPEQAAADNLLAVVQNKVQPSWEPLESFLKDVEAGRESVFKMVQYTTEGDPILTGLAFDGAGIDGLYDNSRDTFAGTDDTGLTEFHYEFIKTFESGDELYVYLLDDDTITLERLQADALKSDASEPIGARLLFFVEK